MKRIYLDQVDSTQTYITELLPDNEPHEPVAVYTFNQLKGKGQANKKWISKPNAGIALSLAFPFPKSSEIDWVLVNKHICSNIIIYLREHLHPDFFLKWPNDIVIHDRKFGGMIMNVVSKENTQYLVLGLGLNLRQPPRLPLAIGLREILNKNQFDTLSFTSKLITFLKNTLEKKPSKKTSQQYTQLLWRLDESVEVQYVNKPQTESIHLPSHQKFIGVDHKGMALFHVKDHIIGSHSGTLSILLPPRKIH